MTADEARQQALNQHAFYKEVQRAIGEAAWIGKFRCEVNAEPSDTLAATISSLRKAGYFAEYNKSLQKIRISWYRA
jgi:hypothetical protein